MLDNLDFASINYAPHVVTVGCAFGSIVEFPEIPISEAVATCHAIRDKLDAALCECEAQGAPTKPSTVSVNFKTFLI